MNRSIKSTDSNLDGIRIASALLVAIFMLSLIRYQPTSPLPADHPPDLFSAERAMPVLAGLVGDGIPRPSGSEHNTDVRDLILDEFASMGYETAIQEATVERRNSTYPIFNIMARLEGTGPGNSVLLLTHYDSVRWGPGASDSGVSVAIILEIARILRSDARFLNDIIFLLTDAEEIGLLGARAFVEEHPWFDSVKAFVNLDARGTSGPSLMYETSEQNLWLARIFARKIRRPFTSSVFVEIYKTMPNDSDFTIFKRKGIAGYNFAFIGSASHYHTAQDNLENVSLSSLQHQGDNALALVRALSSSDLTEPTAGQAVFFDLFSAKVIVWPQGWTIPLAILSLLLLLAVIIQISRHRFGCIRHIIGSMILWLVMLVGAMVCGLLFDQLLKVTGTNSAVWLKHPVVLSIAIWLLVILWIVVLVHAWIRRFKLSGIWEMWCGIWIWWAVIGLLAALLMPGASYLAIVPALFAGLFGIIGLRLKVGGSRHAELTVPLLSLLVVACLWIPMEPLFYDAFGFNTSINLVAQAAMVAAALMPLLVSAGHKGRQTVAAGTAMLLIISTVTALILK